MPPLFLIKLASSLVGNRLAKAGAWVLIALAVAILLGVAKCTYDRNLIDRHDAEVTGKTLRTDAKAKEDASERRAADTIANDTAEKERNDEIAKAAPGRPSDAAVRLGCQRLRQAGKDTSRIAACTGFDGGSEADPD
jgi:hypothetical protein